MVEASGIHIEITDKEQKLFDTLLAIVKANNLKTTLRCAGGWVRDKVSLIINRLNACADPRARVRRY